MNSFTQFINTLGVVRIAALAAVAMAVMTFFLYIITRFSGSAPTVWIMENRERSVQSCRTPTAG